MSLELDKSGSYRHPHAPGEPHTGKPRLSVTDLEASILAELLSGTVLEIGTGLGVSTRALAEVAALVVTVDPDPWVHETVWPYLPDNVQTFTDPKRIPTAVDAAFIDGDHSTSQVRADVEAARSCGARLIVVHDANHQMVRDGLDGDWLVIPTEHGLGVWRAP